MHRALRLSLLSVVPFVAAASVARAQQRGRPIVLLMHGRGMNGRDTAATRRDWADALQAGVASLGAKSLLNARDVRVVWYADVLEGASSANCDYAKNDPRARREAKEDPALKSLISLAGGILSLLSTTVDDSDAVNQTRGLASDATFLADARKRCAAEQRLGDAIASAKRDGRPVILVAHSLGAVAAYDYLSSRSDTNVVQRFITLGSPLGSDAVRKMLIGGDSTDVITKLASVHDWVNIRHTADDLAMPTGVARDTTIDAPGDETNPHELLGYLRDTATARGILNGWCVAFAVTRPQGCIGVVSR
jgi:pimeloyl-ACP methyl ester carboxylesterase